MPRTSRSFGGLSESVQRASLVNHKTRKSDVASGATPYGPKGIDLAFRERPSTLWGTGQCATCSWRSSCLDKIYGKGHHLLSELTDKSASSSARVHRPAPVAYPWHFANRPFSRESCRMPYGHRTGFSSCSRTENAAGQPASSYPKREQSRHRDCSIQQSTDFGPSMACSV